MAAIQGYKGDIYVASGVATTFTGDAMTDTGDHKDYKITASTKRFWDPASTITVYVDGSPVTTGFRIVHAGGHVIFDASQGAAVITVTGKYFAVSKLAAGRDWSLDYGKDLIESTVFGDTAKKFTTGQGAGSLSFSRLWQDEFFTTNATTLLGFTLYLNQSAGTRYDAMGYPSKDSIKSSTSALVEENVNFAINGEISYSAS